MKPIHKFNGGRGATLCHKCSVIISEGLTEDLYCEKCEQKIKRIMKNIHVLSTDKPSRLSLDDKDILHFAPVNGFSIADGRVNIYITSDEEIKVGDWYYLPRTNSVHKCKEDPTELNLERRLGVAKIILTTDQDLIKDGVQAIDDDFLEWFISKANDSGKPIDIFEVTYGVLKPFQSEDKGYLIHFSDNEVLEEPKQDYTALLKQVGTKQETLEEAISNYIYKTNSKQSLSDILTEAIKFGAKWQAERMYSEEEVILIIEKEETKTCDNIHKEPHFYWTKELVAEFAREVALEYKTAEKWSSDLHCEKQMADSFIKRKKFEQIHKDLIVSDAGQTLIVNKQKFEELVKFLFNYRDAD